MKFAAHGLKLEIPLWMLHKSACTKTNATISVREMESPLPYPALILVPYQPFYQSQLLSSQPLRLPLLPLVLEPGPLSTTLRSHHSTTSKPDGGSEDPTTVPLPPPTPRLTSQSSTNALTTVDAVLENAAPTGQIPTTRDALPQPRVVSNNLLPHSRTSPQHALLQEVVPQYQLPKTLKIKLLHKLLKHYLPIQPPLELIGKLRLDSPPHLLPIKLNLNWNGPSLMQKPPLSPPKWEHLLDITI
jgi:hypothetical protein